MDPPAVISAAARAEKDVGGDGGMEEEGEGRADGRGSDGSTGAGRQRQGRAGREASSGASWPGSTQTKSMSASRAACAARV